jgi:antitoxin component of MazEF toxin-antitoxin module
MKDHKFITIQRILTVGNSKGVSLPKKWLRAIGVECGDYVMLTVEKLSKRELQAKLIQMKKERN